MKKNIMLFVVTIENVKTLNNLTFFLFIIYIKCENEDEKIFKEKESIGTLDFLSLLKSK